MKKVLLITLAALTTMLVSCKKQSGDLSSNPFVNPQETYLSSPDFNAIKIEHYLPAFEEGIRLHQEEIDAIANNQEPATFENTIEALEKSGTVLNRVSSVFFALTSADTNDELIAISTKIQPKLSAHYSALSLNDKLFERIKTVYETGMDGLDEEAQRVTKLYYDSFKKNGALLKPEDKKRVAALNEEAAKLTDEFSNKLNDASNEPLFFSKEELEGLSEDDLKKASELAEKEGKSGQYMLYLENTTQQPVLASLKNRDTRKAIFEASINRCKKGNDNDTRKIIKRIAEIRAEKAEILGYKNYAEWNLTDALAKKPENAIDLLTRLADLAKTKIESDQKEIEDYAKGIEGKDFKLEAWDWNYYAEQLRKEKYGVDEATLNQYFVMDSVLINGVFYAANKMYGLTFTPNTKVSVYHKDVTAWDVMDKDGTVIALFYFDPFSRPSKSGGAWMSNFVEQSFLLNQKPVIYNVCNNPKPATGKPALISWDNVETMFHEFGHALHGIFANQKYPYVSGTNVPRDFVEMPSQFNEHCATDPDVFAHYARHYETGEVMPKELQDKMAKAHSFNQAYPLAENVAASLLDLAWHTLSLDEVKAISDIDAFQQAALEKYGVNYAAIPPRYGTTYFRHIWTNGYASGYYAYLWTEALCHEIYEAMVKSGGLTAANGQRFRDMILSRGNSTELMPLFTAFTGHEEVDIAPLLKARGLMN